MTTRERLQRLAGAIPDSGGVEGYVSGALPGLGFLRHSAPTPIEGTVYEPVVCLILRGRKRTTAGSMAVEFGPGESLIVSHALPVLSQVTECPYLAMTLALDIGILRSLVDQIDERADTGARAATLDVERTEELLIEALTRYVAVAGSPTEARVLAPLVLREIHFRLLMAPHGGMLRKLLRADSTASHIHRAVREIRENFRSTLSVPRLARRIGMSESAFHRHFKSITGTTPLQYQKTMRLFEARRLISAEGYGVSRAAIEVGYASPTQFSREYSREFGVAPRVHTAVAAR
ncbi:MAG: AraC family transcriptional regulator [Gemmatimonadota bacterium]